MLNFIWRKVHICSLKNTGEKRNTQKLKIMRIHYNFLGFRVTSKDSFIKQL
jgi:hypothetical protein